MSGRRAPCGIVIATLIALAACGPGPAPTALPLEVSNGTTIGVSLWVNGRIFGTVDPGGQVAIGADALGPLPWLVDLRSGTGRILLGVEVASTAITRTTGPDGQVSLRGGAAGFLDMPCGRLAAWVGPPVLGPAPEPGFEGPCPP